MTLNLDLNDPLTVTCKGRSRVQGHTNSILKAQVTDHVSDSTSVTMPFDLASNSGQDKLGQRPKARPRQVWPSMSELEETSKHQRAANCFTFESHS